MGRSAADRPELEELPFWQAMALAEKPEHTAAAIEILRSALAQDPRREHWLDLIEAAR